MNTLQVRPEDLKAGKRYFIESKEKVGGHKDIMIVRIRAIESTCFIVADGCDITTYYTGNFNFYSVPDDFEIKWNQREGNLGNPCAIMYQKLDDVAQLSLRTGCTFSDGDLSDFSDILPEPETVTLFGKKYNVSDIQDRIKELKEVK